MIKGFAITPVIEGRIGIGEIVEQGGKRLPHKLDHIVITKMHQANGTWAKHPLMDELITAQKTADPKDQHADKLRSIPVRILFDKPENNFRAEYTCFDDKGRPICSGDGEKAKRRTGKGIDDVACPGADICDFGKNSRCKQFGRLLIGMESSFENDPLVGFMFRTTSFNSIRALTFRLRSFAASTQNKMAGMPCNLVMKAKSTAASFRKPIFYLDLEPREGLLKAVGVAAEYRKQFEAAGLNRDELEASVSEGIAQSAFFEGGDDGEEVVEEFYSLTEEMEQDESGKRAHQAATHGSGAAQDQTSSNRCSAEQIAEIERLLTESGKEVGKLLEWLVKPAGTQLANLSPEEAARAITAMSRQLAKPAVSEPAAAASEAQPSDATSEKPRKTRKAKSDDKPVATAAPQGEDEHRPEADAVLDQGFPMPPPGTAGVPEAAKYF